MPSLQHLRADFCTVGARHLSHGRVVEMVILNFPECFRILAQRVYQAAIGAENQVRSKRDAHDIDHHAGTHDHLRCRVLSGVTRHAVVADKVAFVADLFTLERCENSCLFACVNGDGEDEKEKDGGL